MVMYAAFKTRNELTRKNVDKVEVGHILDVDVKKEIVTYTLGHKVKRETIETLVEQIFNGEACVSNASLLKKWKKFE